MCSKISLDIIKFNHTKRKTQAEVHMVSKV